MRRIYMDANATTPLLPEVFDAMRAHLILALTTDPRGLRLVERARRAPRVERSGTRAKPGATGGGKKEQAG